MRRIRLKTEKGKKCFVKSVNRRLRQLNLQRASHRIQLCAAPRRSSRVKISSQNIPERISLGDESGLEVTNVPGKGRGVIATQHFKKGSPLLEYVGKKVSESEGLARDETMAPELGSYLFFYRHKGKGYCIDATSELNLRKARLVNHSKNSPNAIMKKVVCLEQGVRLILFAYKDISPSDEILYDYGEQRKKTVEEFPWLKD